MDIPFEGEHPLERWPPTLQRFLESVEWVFAKTYAATWPHHYLVKKHVDSELFLQAVLHVRRHGYLGRFYSRRFTYFEQDGLVYWTMVPPEGDPGWYPAEEETILNRCPAEDTYEARLKRGALPP